MQIEIYNPTQGEPLPPIKWNYEELKTRLTEALADYKGRIYTEKNINDAKKDRARLNNLAEAIDNRRKEMKARYLAPYKEFESQAKELTALVKEQAAEIDAQVKVYEEARKAEKLEHIKARYTEIMGGIAPLVPYQKIHDKRWLNVTYSMSAIDMEISEKAESIRMALSSIDALGLSDEMTSRIKSVYLKDLNLATALTEKDKIEREQQALAGYEVAKKQQRQIYDVSSDPDAFKKAKPGDVIRFGGAGGEAANQHNVEEQVYTVDFRVFATSEQLGMLKAFLQDNNIKYGRVPNK